MVPSSHSAATRCPMLRKPKSRNKARAASRSMRPGPAGRPVDRQRHVGVQADQLAAQQGLIAEPEQVLLPFGPRHLGGMIEDGLQRAILFEQLPGELRPDQRHARHVVDRVAHQRLEIDHLPRRDPPLLPKRAASKSSFLRML